MRITDNLLNEFEAYLESLADFEESAFLYEDIRNLPIRPYAEEFVEEWLEQSTSENDLLDFIRNTNVLRVFEQTVKRIYQKKGLIELYRKYLPFSMLEPNVPSGIFMKPEGIYRLVADATDWNDTIVKALTAAEGLYALTRSLGIETRYGDSYSALMKEVKNAMEEKK